MYCRVRYIENPWYDDHFDIPTERQRIGKTLTMIAGAGGDLLSRGSLLVGWALYEKLDNVQSLMRHWLDDSSKTPLVTAAMVRTDLTVLRIGFCLTGPISLCLDSFLCMYYFVSDCTLHACVVL